MRRIIFLSLAVLIIFSSCKLKDDLTKGTTNPVEPGVGSITIQVVSPNGGESIPEGSAYQIQWTGTGTIYVRIQYSFDNGSSWGLVVDSLKNTGTYSWFPVPNTISNQCRIRVSSVDGQSSDESDKVFAIVKNTNESLRIISPVGKELWEAGSAKQIKWYSSGLDSVKIEYTTNNGQRWNLIAVDKKNTGIYYWEPVPNTPSTLAKVRITDAKDGSPSTESPEPFEILPERTIKVITPNGGEEWYAGSSDNIKWQSTGIANVKIEYTINGGGSWSTIVASTPSTGAYSWNSIPNVSSLQCRIRISDADNSGITSDISDENFTITFPGAQLINVTSPDGGEKWAAGSTQTIKWDASGITNVKIEYTINNGINWNIITASAPSTGFYTWNQVPNLPSTNCKIRISDAQDNSPSDASDDFFSITPAPSIVITSPNGGETLLSGTTKSILYTSQYVPNVKIEYTTDGGAFWTTIDNSTPAIGTYDWLVPNLNSSQCKVKVSDALFGDPLDMSDNNFIITNVVIKSIKVVSPNGGEDWEAGTKQNITWSSTAINKVKIELTTDKGSNWTVLVDSISGGAYEWNISQTLNSTQCQIRLSDARDNKISDVSDATFIISPRKYIFVTNPVGPVTYKSSDPIDIVWESSGIKTVGIKYTWTNGVAQLPNIPAFTVLVDKIANEGKFTTSFSLPSDQYYVVVYNADEGSNGSPSARNIGNFTIKKTEIPQITVSTPNGGEQWLVTKAGVPNTDIQNYHPYEIRWNATGMEKVKIEWSTTGGGSWNIVPGADSTTNDGFFVWAPGNQDVVRPDSSDNCLIRISSLNGTTSDLSDNFFSIHESKKIRVEFPNKGEDFWTPTDLSQATINWPMLIRWTSYAVTSVNIYYSLDNGVTWNTLVTNYQSTGAYSWDFVQGPIIEARISTLGRIKIVDASDGRIWDINDIPFWLHVKKTSGSIIKNDNLEEIQPKK